MKKSVSLYLDLVRVSAALVVFLSHVSLGNISGGQLGIFSSFGVQAVDVFFVLSGYVIFYVYLCKEKHFSVYAISRLARIYSVTLPAIALTALLDFIGMHLSPAAYGGPYQALSAGVVSRSITFLNEQWGTHRFPGSDSPFWSLGFEVWYYIGFAAFVFSPQKWRWVSLLTIIGFIGPKVVMMAPCWLLGVIAYKFSLRGPLNRKSAMLLCYLPIFILIGYEYLPHASLQPFCNFGVGAERWISLGQDYLISFLVAAHIVGISQLMPENINLFNLLERSIRWVSGATFSIYLGHLPIMTFLAAVFPMYKNTGVGIAAIMIATLFFCLIFAEVGERRKDMWRALFKYVFSYVQRFISPSR